MKVKVWGGAGEYGRSCYYVENKTEKIVFDCGINRSCVDGYPKVEKEVVPLLQAVFLSHIHEDHTMGLPLLAKHGYKQQIWTTRYTMQQLPSYFEKWRDYNHSQGRTLPYNERDIQNLNYICIDEISNPNEWVHVTPSLRFQWGYSGHVLGSVWFLVDMAGTYVFYSGDYTSESYLLRANLPENLQERIKVAIVDAAYHTEDISQNQRVHELFTEIERVISNKGMVLLPLPPLGRAQDILLHLQQRYNELSIMVDKEIIDGFEKMKMYKEWIKNKEEIEQTLEKLKRNIIVMDKGKCTRYSHGIIVMSDANMQTKRAQWYYEQLRNDERNSIIFTGHIAMRSFAGNVIKEPTNNQCTVGIIPYKVHQGITDIKSMLNNLLPEHTILVHSLKADTDRLQRKLSAMGYKNLYSLTIEDIHLT
ncbi:MBL fold metallo-hydrolase [Bacillus sp. NPDC094106]|uniref:MBL fold metallo-hydrolase n=1 Tax=Bacillus sp. NPDC094106 TaxID=3363949 RepID=UPI0038118A3C